MAIKDDMALLERLGQACYGDEWIRPLARDLAINHRTVSRWATGQALIPEHGWRLVIEHAMRRQNGLRDAISEGLSRYRERQ
jgi:hypothetical protein